MASIGHVPISFIFPTYNEEDRIRTVLQHGLCWADEIVVADKGSTDQTVEICRSFGDRIRIEELPYSERGNEKVSDLPQLVSNDWIFFGTCSELPTRKLIEKCREIIDKEGEHVDLIYVPRKMYYFGLHFATKDWGVCHYPFLINRKRAIVTDKIHDNFHASDTSRTRSIPYADDCCVYHLTNPTARAFWMASAAYFEAEARETSDPEKEIRQCFKNLDRLSEKVLIEGENWVPFYCSYASYHLGKALYLWEKANGGNQVTSLYYRQLAMKVLEEEWNVKTPETSLPTLKPIKPLQFHKLNRFTLALSAAGKFAYLLMKLTLAIKRLFLRETKR